MAVADGVRESSESWRDILLLDLKKQGLEHDPSNSRLAMVLSASGKRSAEVFPATRQQRCWVHKTANVLNYLPKHKQATVKADLHDIWMAGNAR